MNIGKRILWIGFHKEGKIAFEKLLKSDTNIVGVITLTKEEREKRSGSIDYNLLCADTTIPVYEVSKINSDTSLDIIKNLNPDMICVIGWSQILSKNVLDTADLVVGAHASLLPKNRGSAPVNWAIINGEKSSGNTLMVLSSSVDAGDIIFQEKFPITLFDSCDTIYNKIALTNSNMIFKAVKAFNNNELDYTKQNITDSKLLPRRKPEDGLIDWNADNLTVYNFIRALTKPYPGAFTEISGIKIFVWDVSYSDLTHYKDTKLPGTIIGYRYSYKPELCGLEIQCGQGNITVHKITITETDEELFGEELVTYFKEIKMGESFEK